MAQMTETQLKKLEIANAAKSPEAKILLEHLLTESKSLLNNQEPTVYKGFMMAYFAIKDQRDK